MTDADSSTNTTEMLKISFFVAGGIFFSFFVFVEEVSRKWQVSAKDLLSSLLRAIGGEGQYEVFQILAYGG